MNTIGQQQTIPELINYLSSSRGQVGAAGELLIARTLEMRGYRVSTSHRQGRGDLSVINDHGEIFYLEIKTARRGKDGKYCFTLYKHWQGRVCSDHRHADIVILLCLLKTGYGVPFVVPVAELATVSKACITSYPTSYNGRFAQYRQKLNKLSIEV